MLVLLGLMFVCNLQSLVLILSLIIITLFYSYYLYNFMGTYWFSYMILLIVLSGVLVVFTYIVSLMSDEIFEMTGLVYLCMMIFFIFFFNCDNSLDYFEDSSLLVMKMWESLMGMFNIFVVMFLFMIMLMVVWLSKLEDGALRNFY